MLLLKGDNISTVLAGQQVRFAACVQAGGGGNRDSWAVRGTRGRQDAVTTAVLIRGPGRESHCSG